MEVAVISGTQKHGMTLANKRQRAILSRVETTSNKLLAVDYSKPARTSALVKGKFLAARKLQGNLGKQDPDYADYKYWKSNGWLDDKRPWK